MTQNMFQEGLYQVFFKERPRTTGPKHRSLVASTNEREVKELRLARWFGAVINVRLLITGVRDTAVINVRLLITERDTAVINVRLLITGIRDTAVINVLMSVSS